MIEALFIVLKVSFVVAVGVTFLFAINALISLITSGDLFEDTTKEELSNQGGCCGHFNKGGVV